MTDLNYRIIGSNEIREKLYKKLLENKNYVLILNLDEIIKEL